MLKTRSKIFHRSFTIIAAFPLFITVFSGSLYSILQYYGLDFFWLMKIHTGNFFFINLQPLYTPFLGFLTIAAIISGLFLFPRSKSKYRN